MRYLVVAANWKMNGTRASVAALLNAIKPVLEQQSGVEVIVFPPFVFLDQVAKLLAGSSIAFGAQNVCAEADGAYTGEISTTMLLELGCRYVLIGHSERRALYGEEDAIIARKFLRAEQQGLIPILCVGETREERESGTTQDVVARQLQAILSLEAGMEMLANAIVAYEPVWAIGTGLTATPEEAQTVHAAIREQVAHYDADIAAELRILYGGSVKASNATQLFAMPDIDGALVGGASLDAQEFISICKIAAEQQQET